MRAEGRAMKLLAVASARIYVSLRATKDWGKVTLESLHITI
jgi:hypothetical protein